MPSVLIQKNAPAHSNGLETSNANEPLSSGTAAKDERLLAGRQLSVGRPDLPLRQSAAEASR